MEKTSPTSTSAFTGVPPTLTEFQAEKNLRAASLSYKEK